MGIENRRHLRARVKWHIVIRTPNGLVDGKTENLSLRGAFIRLSGQLDSNQSLPMVIDAKGRFVSCTAQVVWTDNRDLSASSKSLGIGVRFTQMMLNDRQFLHGQISNHL